MQMESMHATSTPERPQFASTDIMVFFNHDEHEDVVAEETKRGHKIDLC